MKIDEIIREVLQWLENHNLDYYVLVSGIKNIEQKRILDHMMRQTVKCTAKKILKDIEKLPTYKGKGTQKEGGAKEKNVEFSIIIKKELIEMIKDRYE